MRSVVSKAYEQITSTGEMTLFKSHHPDYRHGEQMRDFLYVKDAVLMTIWLAETPGANGLFNLGSGKARTWLDLGRSIFSALKIEEDSYGVDSSIHLHRASLRVSASITSTSLVS